MLVVLSRIILRVSEKQLVCLAKGISCVDKFDLNR